MRRRRAGLPTRALQGWDPEIDMQLGGETGTRPAFLLTSFFCITLREPRAENARTPQGMRVRQGWGPSLDKLSVIQLVPLFPCDVCDVCDMGILYGGGWGELT